MLSSGKMVSNRTARGGPVVVPVLSTVRCNDLGFELSASAIAKAVVSVAGLRYVRMLVMVTGVRRCTDDLEVGLGAVHEVPLGTWIWACVVGGGWVSLGLLTYGWSRV